jgi:outer membrane murein-binding lipoprotein Lpp
VNVRRATAAAACAALLGVAGAACADSKDDSGAVTKVDELGPQVAKLRLEVSQLRQEVRTLREEIALLTPTTDPETGLSIPDDTTGSSLRPE